MHTQITQAQYNLTERHGQLVITLNNEIIIPENDPVRLLSAQLEELEYGKLYEAYSSIGRKWAADPKVMDTWYQGGTECVFACGGGVYTSAAEAAAKVSGKVIGVDVDQSAIIDGQYGKGMLYASLLAVACINFKADQTLVGTALNLLGTAAATVIVKAINSAENPDNVSATIQYVNAKKAFLVNIGSFEFNWFMVEAVTQVRMYWPLAEAGLALTMAAMRVL